MWCVGYVPGSNILSLPFSQALNGTSDNVCVVDFFERPRGFLNTQDRLTLTFFVQFILYFPVAVHIFHNNWALQCSVFKILNTPAHL